MKVFLYSIKRGADGSKHLDLQIHGDIDGGWYDEDEGVSTPDIVRALKEHADAKTVRVGINSYGGSAFGGVAVYNALRAHPGDVTCVVEGIAASAASLIAMGGRTCMGVGAMLMIHPPSSVAIGNADEMRKTADVLDKIQEGIGAIYTAKTGKSADEVKALVKAETWMTAEEAVASGFADEIAHAEPDGDEQGGGKGDGDGDEPTDLGDLVMWRGVEFPKATLPSQIVALAKPRSQRPVPIVAITPPPPVAPLVNRAYLAEKAPELLASLVEEGRIAERARLKEIDDLGVRGAHDLVAAAKYGDNPQTAQELAVVILKAGQLAGAELLALRRKESEPLAVVTPGAPDQTGAAAEARVINAMVAGGNARRGGNGQ